MTANIRLLTFISCTFRSIMKLIRNSLSSTRLIFLFNIFIWSFKTYNLIITGFACILINFRGSAGSGDSSIHFLPGRIGSADVKDCKLATDQVVDNFPINNGKLILYGGSYGGTLVTHLSGLYPDVYKATVAKNPVIDLASMHGGDIADWWVFVVIAC